MPPAFHDPPKDRLRSQSSQSKTCFLGLMEVATPGCFWEMRDTVDDISADIMASSGPNGPALVDRLRTLCRALKDDAKKNSLRDVTRNRILTGENRDLKTKVAKLTAEIIELKSLLQPLETQVAKQTERITEHLHEQFGQKSETSGAQRRRSSTPQEERIGATDVLPRDKHKDFAFSNPKHPETGTAGRPKTETA